ncbi:MAG TPA: hypothetical protein PKA02_01900 [Candidatus Saccharibacteria bacterium]|nr:hypothetical protein [Candidatus Saccharibacteria bacterium]
MPTELFHEGMLPDSKTNRLALNERYARVWNSMLQATIAGQEEPAQEAVVELRAIEPLLLPAQDH